MVSQFKKTLWFLFVFTLSPFLSQVQAQARVFTDVGANIEPAFANRTVWADYDKDGDLDILLMGGWDQAFDPIRAKILRNDNGNFIDIVAGLPAVNGGCGAWGDYDRDGDLDLLLTGSGPNGVPVSKILSNNNGVFTNINAAIVAADEGCGTWADYDKDGDLDVGLTGRTNTGVAVSKIYRNDGGVFRDSNVTLPGIVSGSITWGDYDNDGDPDFILGGINPLGQTVADAWIGKIYRNDGSGRFTAIGASIIRQPIGQHAADWGDYDKDGDLDIVVTGYNGTDIYRNDGSGLFTLMNIVFEGGAGDTGSVTFGDYDKDGDPDLLIVSSGSQVFVYRNDGGNVFTNISANIYNNVSYWVSGAWGDYDGDSDLDLLLSGQERGMNRGVSKIYRNEIPGFNVYTISGKLQTSTGTAIASATVTGNGTLGAKTTDASGNYSFTGVARGTSYTLTPSKAGYTFSPASASGTNVIAGATHNFTGTASALTYTISGKVQTSTGAGIASATVTGSGSLGTRTTDASGNYSFTGVLLGTSYTLTPSKAGYAFSPASASGSNLSAGATHNFVGAFTYTISGKVQTSTGAGLASVTVTGSGSLGTKTTDASGNYSFTGVVQGTSYTLTPSKAGYAFSPTSASGSNLSASVVHNFTGAVNANTYTVSGKIQTSTGSALSGVTVTGNGSLGTRTTDASGNYSFSGVPHGISYTVTPSKTGYSFNPVLASNPSLSAAATHNFTGALVNTSFTISGKIQTSRGVAISGVTITGSGGLGTSVTGSSGTYSFTGVPYGTTYTLTPSKAGYVFTRIPAQGDPIQGSVVLDFTGDPITYTISGSVRTSGGIPVASVAITGNGSLGSKVTDAAGNYAFTGVASGTSYVITATRAGYSFNPSTASGSNLGSSAIHNFTALDLTSDVDLDGVTDVQEIIDGTNPLDKGSYLPVLRTHVCSEWNGFLGGMYNIIEHVNVSTGPLRVLTKLYSLSGEQKDSVSYWLDKGRQLDVLAHDLKGRDLNSYGLVCSDHDGDPGDMDGRMVYYRYSGIKAKTEFAFAMPFQNPRKGEQVVQFNTYQPSLDSRDASNLVANWIQVSNLADSVQRGTLYFYGYGGNLLGSYPITLAAKARYDAPGHVAAGPLAVGIARWMPEDPNAEFIVRNVRYLYDNSRGVDSFTTAFQLEGSVGTGELVSAPLDTRSASSIVEISNTLNTTITVAIRVYTDQGGNPVYREDARQLPAYGSYHLITDSLLSGRQGTVAIDSDVTNGVVATVMQYGRTVSGGVAYMFGIPAKQAIGSVMKGSYNTFLNQSCSLLLVNPSDTEVIVGINVVRYDGRNVSNAHFKVPAHGEYNDNLCSRDKKDVYGVVTVQPQRANTIYSVVVRAGDKDSYRFPTPVRQ